MRRASAHFLLAILLAFALFAGCVREAAIVFPQSEVLVREIESDMDGDNATDTWTYVFKPAELDGFTVSRVVQLSTITKEQLKLEGKAQRVPINVVTGAKQAVGEFDAARKFGEAACKKELGLDAAGCSDIESCKRSCTTAACTRMLSSVGDKSLEWVADFSKETSQVDAGVAAANARLEVLASGSEDAGDIEKAIAALGALTEHSSAVARNSLLNPALQPPCQPIDYKNSRIKEAVGALSSASGAKISRQATSSAVYHNFITLSQKQNASTGYLEIRVTDKVPPELAGSPSDIQPLSNASKVIGPPLGVVWEFAHVGGAEFGSTLGYYIVSEKPVRNELVKQELTGPQVSIREVSLTQSPTFLAALGVVNIFFGLIAGASNYYIAFGATAFIVYFLLARVLWVAARMIYGTLLAMRDKRPIQEMLYRMAGHARPEMNTYIAFGAVMLVLGLGIALSSPSPLSDKAIVLAKTASNLTTDPVKSAGAFFIFLGVLSLYFIVEDFAKGALIGKRYYQTAVDVAREASVLKYNELLEAIDALKAAVAEAEKMRLDPSEARELLYSIPLEKIKVAMRGGQNLPATLAAIDQSIASCEMSAAKLGERMALARERSGEWGAKIRELFSRSGRVSEDMLLDVPHQFRKWALEKYLDEHGKDGLVIEGGVLMKPSAEGAAAKPGAPPVKDIPDLLEDLVASGKVDSAALFRKDGTLIASSLKEGVSPNMAASLSSKMLLAADLAAGELNEGRVTGVTGACANGMLLLHLFGNNALLGTVRKDGDAEFARSALQSVSKKIGEMLAQQK